MQSVREKDRRKRIGSSARGKTTPGVVFLISGEHSGGKEGGTAVFHDKKKGKGGVQLAKRRKEGQG